MAVSENRYLMGNYAPVSTEVTSTDLKVTGSLPEALCGRYLRNGPNPLFKPIYYAYPMDGDGMIHAVYFDNGRARYRNRFVKTSCLETERRAGRADKVTSLRQPRHPSAVRLERPDQPAGEARHQRLLEVARAPDVCRPAAI